MSDSHPEDESPDLKDDVEIRQLADLVPYGENPKSHPTEQIDKIASSIRRFGWDQPIVLDAKGTIIKGHGRYQAAQKLGLDRVPVIEQTDLSDAESRAARLADNRTAESVWDLDLLGMELELLDESPLDAEVTGFNDDELKVFIDDSEPTTPEDTASSDTSDGSDDVTEQANDAYEEWEDADMPAYENENVTWNFSIKIRFVEEKHLEMFSEATGLSATPRTESAYYPPTDTDRGDIEYQTTQNDESE